MKPTDIEYGVSISSQSLIYIFRKQNKNKYFILDVRELSGQGSFKKDCHTVIYQTYNTESIFRSEDIKRDTIVKTNPKMFDVKSLRKWFTEGQSYTFIISTNFHSRRGCVRERILYTYKLNTMKRLEVPRTLRL